ncbi:MAG TPA: 16S rRNA (guanine(527)-N(7))-methyltransferase RsmG [Dehalococcoidia bacterium]|nr:16S rRNA (guanine(527)-N(7))-methyltransferase RsmG [Dehalococcoidia bacterium]
MRDAFIRDASAYGIALTDAQAAQFERYLELLREWSARINLVGDASAEVVRSRHFLESLALGAALRERELLRPDSAVADVGAGAGFPGLPLKITWPGIRLTLIEATQKKAAFLTAVVEALKLTQVTVLAGRAETVAHDPAHRERYDLVVARAVAPLPALLEFALPFARIGGRVVAPKGSRAAEEVAAARHALEVLGGRAFLLPFAVPGPEQRLVIVAKQRPTPAAYPRRPGMATKSPL